MSDREHTFRCRRCDVQYDTYNDARSHAYHKHPDEYPDWILQHNTVLPGEEHSDVLMEVLDEANGCVSLERLMDETGTESPEEIETYLKHLEQYGEVREYPGYGWKTE